jgi:hypothetical protein
MATAFEQLDLEIERKLAELIAAEKASYALQTEHDTAVKKAYCIDREKSWEIIQIRNNILC